MSVAGLHRFMPDFLEKEEKMRNGHVKQEMMMDYGGGGGGYSSSHSGDKIKLKKLKRQLQVQTDENVRLVKEVTELNNRLRKFEKQEKVYI